MSGAALSPALILQCTPGKLQCGDGIANFEVEKGFSFLLTLQTVINKHVKQTSLHHKKRSLSITKNKKFEIEKYRWNCWEI